MRLYCLISHPRAFFEAHADSPSWLWAAAGFYLFAFAIYFQNYLVPGYRPPLWFVVYVVAWAPTLLVAAGLFVLLVVLWYWPASRLLGGRQGIERGARIAGLSLLPPGVFFCAALMVLAIMNGNDVAVPYRSLVLGVHSIAGLWALGLIVVGATVSHNFTPRQTALFVLWLVLLAAVIGAVMYALVRWH